MLTVTIKGKRFMGRPLRATRDYFADGLRLIIPGIDPRGDATDWIGHTK